MSQEIAKIVTFFIGSRHMAVWAKDVVEVLSWSEPIRVDAMPDHVLGMREERGRRFPLVDLSSRLSWEPTGVGDRHAIILLQTEFGPNGFIVDWVDAIIPVFDLEQTPFQKPTIICPDDLDGIAIVGARRIEILRTDRIGCRFAPFEMVAA